MQTIPIYSGGSVRYTVIPQTVHQPEKWTLTVRGEVDGEPEMDTYTVTKAVYADYEVGDYVVIADLGLAD